MYILTFVSFLQYVLHMYKPDKNKTFETIAPSGANIKTNTMAVHKTVFVRNNSY